MNAHSKQKFKNNPDSQRNVRLDTSWQNVSKWYGGLVGKKGQFFHTSVIIPKLLQILELDEKDSILDLACGQGILSRHIPKNVEYVGVDLAADLIEEAQKLKTNSKHEFIHADVSEPLELSHTFSVVTVILALQNIEYIQGVFENAYKYLQENGRLVLVINHPYFRIPKYTSWGIDEDRNIQYRRVDAYLSNMKIPIDMTPGSSNQKEFTTSFHYSLQYITEELYEAGFSIEFIQEWISPKKSEGKAAKMENKARNEIPMFLAIIARKL